MGVYTNIAELIGIPLWALFLVIVWSLIWKGIALWKSARKSHKVWFVVLLVLNTVGILEILYIFVFSKIGKGKRTRKKRR